MTLPGGLSIWQVLVGIHVLVTVAVYLPSAVASLLRRYRKPLAEVFREDLRVSVLRPMRGLDPELEENLLSFQALDVPDGFEVLMLVDSPTDEALPLARRLEARYPERFRLIVGTTPGLGNPKVASLLHGLQFARNQLLWVTDSNTRTSDEHLRAQIEAWKYAQRHGRVPTLVHAPMAAVGGSGLGAVFERLQMGTYNNISAETTLVVSIDTVVGKSLLFHRDDLQAVGGLEAFGAVAGEDFLMGLAFHKVGAVQMSNRATHQVLGEGTGLGLFFRRQTRWAATRKHMSPWTYFLLEPFSYFGLLWVWLALGLLPLELVVAIFTAKVVVDGLVLVAYTEDVSPWDAMLVPFKDLVLLMAWFAAIFMRGFTWRGRELSVKHDGNYETPTLPASAEARSLSGPQ